MGHFWVIFFNENLDLSYWHIFLGIPLLKNNKINKLFLMILSVPPLHRFARTMVLTYLVHRTHIQSTVIQLMTATSQRFLLLSFLSPPSCPIPPKGILLRWRQGWRLAVIIRSAVGWWRHYNAMIMTTSPSSNHHHLHCCCCQHHHCHCHLSRQAGCHVIQLRFFLMVDQFLFSRITEFGATTCLLLTWRCQQRRGHRWASCLVLGGVCCVLVRVSEEDPSTLTYVESLGDFLSPNSRFMLS